MMRESAILASLTLFTLSATPAVAQRAIVVVRHAEKETDKAVLAGVTSDEQVPLSSASKARAEALAKALKDADVTAIYTSTALRTQATAAPLARELGVESKPLEADGLARLPDRHRNQVVLIVGHSNTVPRIVDKLLKRPSGIKLSEDEFDKMFVLIPKPGGGWSLVRTKY